jgi:serine/threonine protein phosphatase PrpC
MSNADEFDREPEPSAPNIPELVRPQPAVELVQVEVNGLSHPGKVRPLNEDHFLVVRGGRYLETLQTNFPEEEIAPRYEDVIYGLAVADGVGGSAAGDRASRLAIQLLVNLVLDTPDWIARLADGFFDQEVIHRMTERFARISAAMTAQAQLDPSLGGFATTLTVAWNLARELFVAHIGDSRAYLLRTSQLRLLTRSHTRAQMLVDLGRLAQDDVAAHSLRRVLTKWLGPTAYDVEPDIQKILLHDGDCLLLCTDGLTEMVTEEQIATILGSGGSVADACQGLIDAALQAGGKDNVTAIVARYRFPSQDCQESA